MSPIFVLSRNVLLESRRTGLPWLVLGSLVAAIALAAFLGNVAVTERSAFQTAITATLLRLCAVFLVILQVAASTARERDDKGLELMLALPLSRSAHYLGRWIGHGIAAALIAAAACAPLLLWSEPGAVAAWGVSLVAELALVCAAALFFAMTLSQLVPALAASAGLYILGRAIGSIQAIARGPASEGSAAHDAARWIVDLLALLLPRLERATQSDWLLYGAPGTTEIMTIIGGLLLYAVLLLAAGLFDFHRRSL